MPLYIGKEERKVMSDLTVYKILDIFWYTPAGFPDWSIAALLPDFQVYIGIAAVEINEITGEWKAYIHVVLGQDEKVDKQYIARHGAELNPYHAERYFPRLDINKYKKY